MLLLLVGAAEVGRPGVGAGVAVLPPEDAVAAAAAAAVAPAGPRKRLWVGLLLRPAVAEGTPAATAAVPHRWG